MHRLSRYFGPGFIVAATGIGAGDLIASSVAGANYGTTILWCVLLGGVLKYVLNEGIARWQFATDTTLLSGWINRLPKFISGYFFIYLLLWSFVVAGTLIAFCGLAAHTIFPLPLAKEQSVFCYGVLHTLAATALVWLGRYQLLENTMKFFIVLLFGIVVISAWLIQPEWRTILPHLIFPQLPADQEAILLTLGVMGGVGGSVTLLCYAYWMQEKDWRGASFFNNARIDLAVAYLMTSLFGVAIIVIAAGVQPAQVTGYDMIISIAEQLGKGSGALGKWLFLFGFWGAVFSSMLGVWSGVPYLFTDFVQSYRQTDSEVQVVSTKSKPYRGYLLFMAIPPLLLVAFGRPVWIGILYAVTGAFFMPFLAGLLLYLNNQERWVGSLKNGWWINFWLIVTLLFFLVSFVLSQWLK